MARWRYEGADPGLLADLNLVLQPGEEFDAPEDWRPSPDPHPVYKPLDKKPAPTAAPQE